MSINNNPIDEIFDNMREIIKLIIVNNPKISLEQTKQEFEKLTPKLRNIDIVMVCASHIYMEERSFAKYVTPRY